MPLPKSSIFPWFTFSYLHMEEMQTDKCKEKLFFNDKYSLMNKDYAVMHTANKSHHLKAYV